MLMIKINISSEILWGEYPTAMPLPKDISELSEVSNAIFEDITLFWHARQAINCWDCSFKVGEMMEADSESAGVGMDVIK